MPKTRRSTLSVEVKPGTKTRLAKLAKTYGHTPKRMASNAIETYVADRERLLIESSRAEKEVATGHYIKHEEVKAWLLSWGTDRELSPPKCVCGKDHPPKSL